MKSWYRDAMPRNGDTAVTMRTWAVLTEASALAAVGVLPYLLSMQQDVLARGNARRVAAGKRAISLPVFVALTFAQSHITFGVPAALGLRAGRTMGLGAPYLEARLAGRPATMNLPHVITSAATGATAALAIGALERTVFSGVRQRMVDGGARQPGIWQSVLATAYGGIAEEVLMRLGLQTLIAAGVRRVRGETTVPPSGAAMWPAIAASNLAFGAGHLPATRLLTPLTPTVVARALILNGMAGVAFGYLYWTRGLEAAMVAHAAADTVLHVGGALARQE